MPCQATSETTNSKQMRDPVSSIIWRSRQQLQLEYDRWRPRDRSVNTIDLGVSADDATFVVTIPN
jgi:hypothetical protein